MILFGIKLNSRGDTGASFRPASVRKDTEFRNTIGKLPLMVTLLSFAAVILALLIWGFAGAGRAWGMPRVKLSDLWRWDGTVDRGTYALIGVAGFAIKHNLDRLIASAVFHRKWGLFNYWIPPTRAIRITELPPEDRAFLETMLVVAFRSSG